MRINRQIWDAIIRADKERESDKEKITVFSKLICECKMSSRFVVNMHRNRFDGLNVWVKPIDYVILIEDDVLFI